MLLPSLVFTLFALASAAGAFLLLRLYRGAGAAVAGAALTLVLFALLYAGLLSLLREGGLPW